jgi:hypothetical protein
MDNKSLINLALDLIELDPECADNQLVIKDRLNALGHKVDSYIGFNNFCKSQIDMFEKEIDHLKKQINNYERLQDHLKYKAEQALIALNTDQIKSDNGHKISFRKSEAVEITNMQELPDQFTRKKISIEPDKVAIKEALKNGPVPGAHLKQNKSIVFK